MGDRLRRRVVVFDLFTLPRVASSCRSGRYRSDRGMPDKTKNGDPQVHIFHSGRVFEGCDCRSRSYVLRSMRTVRRRRTVSSREEGIYPSVVPKLPCRES